MSPRLLGNGGSLAFRLYDSTIPPERERQIAITKLFKQHKVKNITQTTQANIQIEKDVVQKGMNALCVNTFLSWIKSMILKLPVKSTSASATCPPFKASQEPNSLEQQRNYHYLSLIPFIFIFVLAQYCSLPEVRCLMICYTFFLPDNCFAWNHVAKHYMEI